MGADQIANVVFGFESLLVGGALMVGQAGYGAVTKPQAAPLPEEKLAVKNDTSKPDGKHHRNRANLDAALAVGVKPALRRDSEEKPFTSAIPPVPKGQKFRP